MIRLVLQLDDKGYLEVSGPVDDKPMCIGLLELAKHLIVTDESWASASHDTPKTLGRAVKES